VWAAWDALAFDNEEIARAEKRYGDIADYNTVAQAVAGCACVVHTTVATDGADPTSGNVLYAGEATGASQDATWLVNMKGLWNVLEACRAEPLCKQVVHIGSCHDYWPGSTDDPEPKSVFFDSEKRRPDGGLYAVQKRLQEEMCRQFHDAHGLPVLVLRPSYIVDMQLGMGRHREPVTAMRNGLVCRHDIAKCCRLASEKQIGYHVLHVVNTAAEQASLCNVGETERLLGFKFCATIQTGSSAKL
jgi:nucleoside-diphosphate-sugar epimerase